MSQQDLDNIALGFILGVDLLGLLGVDAQFLERVELMDLLVHAARIHQVDEVDVEFSEGLQ